MINYALLHDIQINKHLLNINKQQPSCFLIAIQFTMAGYFHSTFSICLAVIVVLYMLQSEVMGNACLWFFLLGAT